MKEERTMKTPSNSQNEPHHNRHNITTDTSLSTEETPEKQRLKNVDALLEKAGFKRGSHTGSHGWVGTHPKGNIRFSHFTKKPKTTTHD
jgi:hypothetical protein